MTETVKSEIRKRIKNFPAMPAICTHLLSKLNDPDLNFHQLAEEMRYDPGLTANILKIANSSQFSFRKAVNSLEDAFTKIGIQQIFQIVISASFTGIIKKSLKGYELPPGELLRHSIWTAVAAEEFAKVLNFKSTSLLFTAGIIHDVGKIVIADSIEFYWSEISSVIEQHKKVPFDEIEKMILGIDHAEAGALLLEKWHFPEELVRIVRWHHEPINEHVFTPELGIIHVADALAYSLGAGCGMEGLHYKISDKVLDKLHININKIEQVAASAFERELEMASILNGRQNG